MKPTNFPGRMKEKQEEAIARAEARAKLSAKDQLAHLDSLFGAGQGAQRERARLLESIEAKAAQAEADAQAKAHAEQVRIAKQNARQAERGEVKAAAKQG